MPTTISTIIFLLAITIGTVHSDAQAPNPPSKTPTSPLAFEIISIRPNNSQNPTWDMRFTASGFHATHVSINMLVAEAYGASQDKLISGMPPWTRSGDHTVNLDAKVDGSNVTEYQKLDLTQRRKLLQAVLADRLKLITHYETRVFSGYALLVAKSGPKLSASKPILSDPNAIKGLSGISKPLSEGITSFEHYSMAELATTLAGNLNALVVDQTGLTDRYDFTLQWTPNESPSDPENTAIVGALQPQLGLRLESAKVSAQVLVIDHIEQPSEN